MGFNDADEIMMDQESNKSYGSLGGCYRAQVVGTNDPENLQRVRVRVFFLHGYEGNDDHLPWAEVIMQGGSDVNEGDIDIPGENSFGYVMFEMGNRDYPIWIGSFFGRAGGFNETPMSKVNEVTSKFLKKKMSKDTSKTDEGPPAPEIPTYSPDIKFWKTRAGHSITMCDIKGKEFTRIQSKTGFTIELNDSINKMILQDPAGQVFIMDALNKETFLQSITEARRMQNLDVEVTGNSIETVMGTKSDHVQANREEGTAGNKLESIGGTLVRMITNLVQETFLGVGITDPTKPVWELDSVLGSIIWHLASGDFNFTTDLGNFKAKMSSGKFQILDAADNKLVEIDTATGTIDIITTAGNSQLKAVNVTVQGTVEVDVIAPVVKVNPTTGNIQLAGSSGLIANIPNCFFTGAPMNLNPRLQCGQTGAG